MTVFSQLARRILAVLFGGAFFDDKKISRARLSLAPNHTSDSELYENRNVRSDNEGGILGRELIKACAATASWSSWASFGKVGKTTDSGRTRCAAKVDRSVPIADFSR